MARRRRHTDRELAASANTPDIASALLAPLPEVDLPAITAAGEREARRLESLTNEQLFRAYHADWDMRPGERARDFYQRRYGLPVVEKRPPRALDPLRWFVGPSTAARVTGHALFGRAPRERRTVCSYRRVRREVMFAKKLRGKGSGARRRHRDEWSNVSCR